MLGLIKLGVSFVSKWLAIRQYGAEAGRPWLFGAVAYRVREDGSR